MFWFNNVAMPWANLKGWGLLYDIKTTKTTLNIKEGIFYSDLPGYSIKVAKKYPDNKTLKSLIIYDHTHNDGNRHVTLADSGLMYTMFGKKYLVFELFNGKDYMEDADRGSNLDASDLAVHNFKKSKIVMSLDAFDLHKTEESQFSHYEIMRDNFQLQADEDSLRKIMSNMKLGFITSIGPNFMYFHKPIGQSIKMLSNTQWVSKRLKKGLAEKSTRDPMDIAIQQVQNMQTFAQTNLTALETRQDKLKTTRLEWHKKFTTSLAILVMFLIGAPLGAIIKKGGFGVPVVVAVSFFILMYILTQQGDKMAKEGKVLVEIGAWISNSVLTLIGMYFLKIALNDSRLFESDFYRVLWDRVKGLKILQKKYSS
jgi:lipopolysaccharide export system permease protein